MTLTITLPLPGDKWGPGFDVRATSDFIGPLETDSFWRITLTAPPNEDQMGQMIHPAPLPLLLTHWVGSSLTVPQPIGARQDWTTGQDAQLQFELVEPTGGVIEDETVQIILDREAGQVRELATFVLARLNAQPTGLTTAQGEQLDRVEASIGISLGVNPLEIVGDVVQAIATHNPLGYGSLSVAYTISGDGTIPDESPISPKWGVYFVAVTIPPGLGHFHGNSEEWHPRLVQWRTTHFIDEIEMVSAVQDFQTHGELWKFPVQTPAQLQYSILPGVVLQARWWQFP